MRSVFLSVFFLYAATGPAVHAGPVSADQVMKANFTVTKVADSLSAATFWLINESGQSRVRKTRTVTKLIPGTSDNRRMVEFQFPPDIAGTITLLIEHSDRDDDLWIYLPALRKVRRLVSSNKRDSFVGTDFSYGDIIGYRVSDWSYRFMQDTKVDGRDCYVIEALPKTDTVGSDTGLSKRVNWIRKDNFVTVKADAYDLGGRLLKNYVFSDLRQVDPGSHKWQPMRVEAKNVQTGHRTVIVFGNYRANVGVKDDYFTTQSMERQE